MSIEALRALTVNESGEPKRSFDAGELITFNLHYRAFYIPDQTRVRASFHIKYLQNFRVGPGDNLQIVFVPIHFWSFDGIIGPGNWVSWTNWRLPESDPDPPSMRLADWERMIVGEHWRMRSWRGIWELTAAISPREQSLGDFDHNRERWLYQVLYSPFLSERVEMSKSIT